MKQLHVIFLATLVLSACGGGYYDTSIVPVQQSRALAEIDYRKLETEIYEELNLLRRDPKTYAALIEQRLKYFRGKLYQEPGMPYQIRTNEGRSAVVEAAKALYRTGTLGRFEHSAGMSRAALDHAMDNGRHNKTGHAGTDGSTMSMRLRRYGTWSGGAGETIAYGSMGGREVVIDLIIDDGVPSRGHREIILTPGFQVVGVGCAPHKRYRVVCVIDFANRYTEQSASRPAS